jgi:hypothetical protein
MNITPDDILLQVRNRVADTDAIIVNVKLMANGEIYINSEISLFEAVDAIQKILQVYFTVVTNVSKK